jgi:DNA polymerase III alpha subunit (gram-positive type)
MNYIILDLEEDGHNGHIIEIGAVKLDSNFNKIDCFQSYVNYTKNLNHIIKKLTGITESNLTNAKKLYKVIKEFKNWIGKDYILCCWGIDDLIVLDKSCDELEINKNWIFKYCNIQDNFSKMFNIDNRISLIDTMRFLNIKPEGRCHRAIYDAINTSKIFVKIFHNIKYFNVCEKCLENHNSEEPHILTKYYINKYITSWEDGIKNSSKEFKNLIPNEKLKMFIEIAKKLKNGVPYSEIALLDKGFNFKDCRLFLKLINVPILTKEYNKFKVFGYNVETFNEDDIQRKIID